MGGLFFLDATDPPQIHGVVNKAFAALGKIGGGGDNRVWFLWGGERTRKRKDFPFRFDTNLFSRSRVRELFLARSNITPFTTIGLKEYGLLSPVG